MDNEYTYDAWKVMELMDGQRGQGAAWGSVGVSHHESMTL